MCSGVFDGSGAGWSVSNREGNMSWNAGESYENEVFDQLTFDSDVEDVVFHGCVFRGCSFQSRGFVDCIFYDCEFVQCNLSLVSFVRPVLTGVRFVDTKMVGLDWSHVLGFPSVSVEGCIMRDNIFMNMNISKQSFISCDLSGSTFSNTKLKNAVFEDCDLTQCQFHQTDLSFADFSTSRNYYINAESNRLKKTIFTLPEAASLLANLDIVLK